MSAVCPIPGLSAASHAACAHPAGMTLRSPVPMRLDGSRADTGRRGGAMSSAEAPSAPALGARRHAAVHSFVRIALTMAGAVAIYFTAPVRGHPSVVGIVVLSLSSVTVIFLMAHQLRSVSGATT